MCGECPDQRHAEFICVGGDLPIEKLPSCAIRGKGCSRRVTASVVSGKPCFKEHAFLALPSTTRRPKEYQSQTICKLLMTAARFGQNHLGRAANFSRVFGV